MKGDGGALEDTNVEISTVDGFQGREVDIVIFSCVRSAPQSSGYGKNGNKPSCSSSSIGLGFVADVNRLNVAMTRAKFSLIIVGNADYLSVPDTEWRRLIQFTRRKGYMYNDDSNAERGGATPAEYRDRESFFEEGDRGGNNRTFGSAASTTDKDNRSRNSKQWGRRDGKRKGGGGSLPPAKR